MQDGRGEGEVMREAEMGKVERKGESEQFSTGAAEGVVCRVQRSRIKIGEGTYQEFAKRAFIIRKLAQPLRLRFQ